MFFLCFFLFIIFFLFLSDDQTIKNMGIFTKANDDKATCKECHKEFTATQGCTSVLYKHLKGKHADLFTELERKDADRMRANDSFEVNSDDSELQSLIGPSDQQQPPTKKPKEELEKRKVHIKKVWDEDNIHQVRLITDIIRWVIEEMKPFSVVEAKPFIRMLKSASLGHYNEISAHTLSCRAIPKIYKFMKKTISDLLNAQKDGLEGTLLTSDIWSARTNHSYISLTGHYLDKNFRLRRFLFAMKYFSEDHTASNISAKITDMVHEIELNPKTVSWITIVTDGAANIQKGSKTNSDIDTSMRRVDHKIPLIVTGSLAAKDKEKKMYICPQWNQLHKKMTGLVNYFHNSGKRTIDLVNKAKVPKMTTTKLVQNCPTRWNSGLGQLESIITLLPAMEQIVGPDGDTSGSELKKLMPDESEISKVKTIIRILKLFEAFSNSVSAGKTVTIPKVVPMLVTIKLGLETTQKLMKNPLIQEVTNYFLLEINRWFPHCVSVQIKHTVAHFLDPQAKGAMTERLDRFDHARNTLVNTLKDLVDRDPTLQPTPPETSSQNIEAADFLDANSLMASLLDNHHTRR